MQNVLYHLKKKQNLKRNSIEKPIKTKLDFEKTKQKTKIQNIPTLLNVKRNRSNYIFQKAAQHGKTKKQSFKTQNIAKKQSVKTHYANRNT